MTNSCTKSDLQKFSHADVKIIAKKKVFKGFFQIDEYQVSHRLYQGGWGEVLTREIFERGDAVGLFLYDLEKDALVFVEQFRLGAIRGKQSPWLLECVAGMFEENENPIDVACREALEEANIHVAPEYVEPMMTYLSSPGGTTEQLHLYIAPVKSDNKQGVYGLDHEGEDIKVITLSRQDALSLLAQGKIVNAATIIGLQWLQLHIDSLRAKWQGKGIA